MGQLGYSPNRAARALRSGTFRTIGILAYRFDRTGEALTTQSVVEAAAAQGYSVTLVGVTNPGRESWESAAATLSDQAVDGLVVIRAEIAAPESLAITPYLPIAASDSRLVGYYPSVMSEQTAGTVDAVEYLLKLGHRTIHHIAGPGDSYPAQLRSAAWQRTLEETGLRAPEAKRGDWSAVSGYQVGRELAADPNVTAVYCANDEMAFGLLRALHEAGRSVPRDVSVIGFDGIALGEFSTPPLTTVAQDFHAIGLALVDLVIGQIKAQIRAPVSRVGVPTKLIVRGTTAPPPS
jgi:DNA-binding LacI/PurR family transcriptional regulator